MLIGSRPKPELFFLPGQFEVNTLAQGALQQITQWLWIEHPTFPLGDGHFTTELLPHEKSSC